MYNYTESNKILYWKLISSFEDFLIDRLVTMNPQVILSKIVDALSTNLTPLFKTYPLKYV